MMPSYDLVEIGWSDAGLEVLNFAPDRVLIG